MEALDVCRRLYAQPHHPYQGSDATGQLQGDGDLGQHPQGLQVVKLAEQFLGAEVGEFLPDFGDIEIEDVTVVGREIALGAHRAAGGGIDAAMEPVEKGLGDPLRLSVAVSFIVQFDVNTGIGGVGGTFQHHLRF